LKKGVVLDVTSLVAEMVLNECTSLFTSNTKVSAVSFSDGTRDAVHSATPHCNILPLLSAHSPLIPRLLAERE
jgi:hypothetical protein